MSVIERIAVFVSIIIVANYVFTFIYKFTYTHNSTDRLAYTFLCISYNCSILRFNRSASTIYNLHFVLYKENMEGKAIECLIYVISNSV